MQVTEMRRLRRALDLTQEQVAVKCGVSRSLIGLVETGRVQAYPSLKKRISRALGCHVQDIWGDDDRR